MAFGRYKRSHGSAHRLPRGDSVEAWACPVAGEAARAVVGVDEDKDKDKDEEDKPKALTFAIWKAEQYTQL